MSTTDRREHLDQSKCGTAEMHVRPPNPRHPIGAGFTLVSLHPRAGIEVEEFHRRSLTSISDAVRPGSSTGVTKPAFPTPGAGTRMPDARRSSRTAAQSSVAVTDGESLLRAP